MQTSHHLWTYHIVGGAPFAFHDAGNPAVIHDGGTTVFHQLLTDARAEEITRMLEEHQCRVLAARKAEGQTAEQRAERLRIQGAGRENEVWPAARCPNCFWFDAAGDEPCGYAGWPKETINEAMDRHETAVIHLINCPIHGDGEDDAWT